MGSYLLLKVQIYNMLQIHVVLCIWKSLETVFLIIEKSGDKWQSKTLFPTIFDLRSSIVLTFSIAAYPVYNFKKYLKDIQLIFIASLRMTNELRHVISNNVAF